MTAAGVAEGERAGEEIGRQREALEEFKLTLAKTCGPRAARFVIHIVAIVLQEKKKSKNIYECENRKWVPTYSIRSKTSTDSGQRPINHQACSETAAPLGGKWDSAVLRQIS
jgi:hypothetical protein